LFTDDREVRGNSLSLNWLKFCILAWRKGQLYVWSYIKINSTKSPASGVGNQRA